MQYFHAMHLLGTLSELSVAEEEKLYALVFQVSFHDSQTFGQTWQG
jgi:hypothetical protein